MPVPTSQPYKHILVKNLSVVHTTERSHHILPYGFFYFWLLNYLVNFSGFPLKWDDLVSHEITSLKFFIRKRLIQKQVSSQQCSDRCIAKDTFCSHHDLFFRPTSFLEKKLMKLILSDQVGRRECLLVIISTKTTIKLPRNQKGPKCVFVTYTHLPTTFKSKNALSHPWICSCS